ncbi:Ltp family lipoprotein [Lachnospiraceae bacterium 50-23]
MRCPRCGNDLRRSKKDPNYGLCDNCRKKYKWIDEEDYDFDDEYDDFDTVPTKQTRKTSSNSRNNKASSANFRGVRNAPAKKKGGRLKIFLIVLVALILIGAVGSLLGGGSESSKEVKKQKTEASGSAPAEKETENNDVPKEYQSALEKAQMYSETMFMSKQGIYTQLTSEYGEKFSAEAAQYAVDNLEADYKANALKKAQEYQDTMSMSPEAIRDQLVSEYGEQFTQEEADYAIDNL